MKGGGGARPNSGPKPKVILIGERVFKTDDPLVFLVNVMRSSKVDLRLRMTAAIALLPYLHVKAGALGKKERADERAKAAADGEGRFKPSEPPKLSLVNPSRGQGNG